MHDDLDAALQYVLLWMVREHTGCIKTHGNISILNNFFCIAPISMEQPLFKRRTAIQIDGSYVKKQPQIALYRPANFIPYIGTLRFPYTHETIAENAHHYVWT